MNPELKVVTIEYSPKVTIENEGLFRPTGFVDIVAKNAQHAMKWFELNYPHEEVICVHTSESRLEVADGKIDLICEEQNETRN